MAELIPFLPREITRQGREISRASEHVSRRRPRITSPPGVYAVEVRIGGRAPLERALKVENGEHSVLAVIDLD